MSDPVKPSDGVQKLARGFGFWPDGSYAQAIQELVDKARAEGARAERERCARICDAGRQHLLAVALEHAPQGCERLGLEAGAEALRTAARAIEASEP